MTEHVEAVMFMRAVRGALGDWPELRWLFAVPNGGWRAKRTAAAMKAEGAQAGVPDYLLPVGRGGYAGLAIELKTATGRVRPEQREWLAMLEGQGWRAVVARGWEEAWDVVRDYMALEPRQRAQEARPSVSGVSTLQGDERPSQGHTERNRGVQGERVDLGGSSGRGVRRRGVVGKAPSDPLGGAATGRGRPALGAGLASASGAARQGG